MAADRTNSKKKRRHTETLGSRLAKFRAGQGLSQSELAARAGITPRMVSAYEVEGARPPLDVLPKLAHALSTTIDELLDGVYVGPRTASTSKPSTPKLRVRKKRGRPRRDVPESFGPRLAALRRDRGMTQEQLASAVGISGRMVAYYEGQGGNPPVTLIPKLANALSVTIDSLFRDGSQAVLIRPTSTRMWRQLQRVEHLPQRDRQAVLRFIDAMLSKQEQAD